MIIGNITIVTTLPLMIIKQQQGEMYNVYISEEIILAVLAFINSSV